MTLVACIAGAGLISPRSRLRPPRWTPPDETQQLTTLATFYKKVDNPDNPSACDAMRVPCAAQPLKAWSGPPNSGLMGVPAELPRTLSNLMAEGPESPPGCPKVYIYDLKPPFQDVDTASLTELDVFGPRPKGAPPTNIYHYTEMAGLSMILWYKIRHSPRCFTADPNRADLFFVPFVVKPKRAGEWGKFRRMASSADGIHSLMQQLRAAASFQPNLGA